MKKNLLVTCVIIGLLISAVGVGGQIIKEKRPDGVTVYKNLDLKQKIEALEKKINELERRFKEMVQITMPTDLGIYADESDPSVPGDIKIVKGAILVLDNCDAATQWSVHSGAGVEISLDQVNPIEGTGCIKVKVPPSTTAIVKATKASGSWNLSTYKYLKASLRTSPWLNNLGGFVFYFGESTYNEQSSGGLATPGQAWSQRSWDISGIGSSGRDGVTIFAVAATNSYGGDAYFYIDYAYADPGPSEVKAFDGDRVIRLYPKVYYGTFIGDGTASLTIPLPRKGVPKKLEICKDGGAALCFWMYYFSTGKSMSIGSTNSWVSNGIQWVGDGEFNVGNFGAVNTNGSTHHFVAYWDD